jgi:hypothetical protein
LLQKVKARKEHTEIIWIYFGVITANAAIIAQKRFVTLKKSELPPKLPLKSKLKMSLAA